VYAGTGVERLNLVGDHVSRETLTYDLFQRAGLIASDTEFVDLYINTAFQALYLTIEQVDEAFLASHLPGDDEGNLYRAYDGGELSYRGPNPDDYRLYYLKKNNESADDYADVIALTDALTNSPDGSLKTDAEAVANMNQWLRWFALNAVVFNQEGALFMGQGDDYFLYHRPSDDRFILIPWDHDATFYFAQGDVWAPNLPIVRRILRHPPFTRLYYQNIVSLMADEFSIATMFPLIDALPAELDGDKDQLKQFVTDRINHLTSYFNDNLPDRALSITTNAGQSFTTTQPTVVLEGECSPYRDVYVNDSAEKITYPSIYEWRYTTPPLRPRANRFVVTDRNSSGSVVTTRTITVTYETFDGGELMDNLTLTLEASPHIILEDIIVPPSLTLTIEPGVTVAFAEGTSLFVAGQLSAIGAAGQPITFTRDQDNGYWGVIGLYGSQEDNRLAHATVEYAGQASYKGHAFAGVSAYDGHLTIEDSQIHDTGHTALDFVESIAYVRRNRVHDTASGTGLRAQRSFVEAEDNVFHDLYGASNGINLSHVDGSVGGAIRNNLIYSVQGDCISLDGVTLPVEGNELHHCTGTGISWRSAAPAGGVIRNNLIYSAQGDCIHLDGIILPIERNRLHHCAAAGISLRHVISWTGTTLLFPAITNNLVRHNAIGIALKDGSMTHLSHNTLVSNAVGLALYDPAGQMTVVNSILWNNGTAISYTTGASITITYSDVQGGWTGAGEENINDNPQFRHSSSADFRLRETSPCIDHGTPRGAAAVDLMGVSRPKGEGYDLGAYEFFEYYSVYLPLAVDKF
jgi:parallel beta-helix repeat protein